jgi:hypothetical protein
LSRFASSKVPALGKFGTLERLKRDKSAAKLQINARNAFQCAELLISARLLRDTGLPGLEVDVHPMKFYADAEVPVYQNFVGNQVAAPVLIKATVAYEF